MVNREAVEVAEDARSANEADAEIIKSANVIVADPPSIWSRIVQ